MIGSMMLMGMPISTIAAPGVRWSMPCPSKNRVSGVCSDTAGSTSA